MQIKNRILLAALFCTAFSSLVYELVWSRQLAYVLGSTALATSSVLAVFMAGLAIGNLYGGRLIDSQKQPARFLAAILIILGVTCIATLYATKQLNVMESHWPAVFGSGFVRNFMLFIISSAVLILPTFLIGAAFPCIIQLYHRHQSSVGLSVSRCYWVDTLGASLGMLLATFWLVPTLGFLRTSILASILNVLTGMAIYVGFDTVGPPPEQSAKPLTNFSSAESIRRKIVYFLFFMSGFAALVLEVLWIRHWSLIYGSGLNAFAIVVVAFLLGLSLGSFLYERCLKTVKSQIVLFSAIELGLGLTAIIVTALFPHIEVLFLNIYYGVNSYEMFVLLMSIICFAILLVPTTMMGMTLPTLSAINVSSEHIGRDFGRLYAANSFGALAGSFCAGFVVIPALGIYESSFLAGGIYLFIAFAFLYCFLESETLRRKTIFIFTAIIFLAVAVFAGIYQPEHIYGGVFYTGTAYTKQDYKQYFQRLEYSVKHIRFMEDGVYGQVTVTGNMNGMLLRTNGKIESGTTGDLVTYQSLLGHIPAIIQDNPKRILNIGLGCGWTIRAAAIHPTVESIDCVEINPLILEVNRNVFHSYNDDVVNNPKVHIIINDGRKYVTITSNKYDAVISEPTDLTSSGISALFTKQFYQYAYGILEENGILCQWFPRYEVTESDYKIILKTIKTVFPYIYEFDMSKLTNDLSYQSFAIVAAKIPLDIRQAISRHKIKSTSLPEQYYDYMQKLTGILERTIARDNQVLENYISDVNTINTDDRPILEFHAAKTRFRKFREE